MAARHAVARESFGCGSKHRFPQACVCLDCDGVKSSKIITLTRWAGRRTVRNLHNQVFTYRKVIESKGQPADSPEGGYNRRAPWAKSIYTLRRSRVSHSTLNTIRDTQRRLLPAVCLCALLSFDRFTDPYHFTTISLDPNSFRGNVAQESFDCLHLAGRRRDTISRSRHLLLRTFNGSWVYVRSLCRLGV